MKMQVIFVLMLIASTAHAGIYKCQSNGHISYLEQYQPQCKSVRVWGDDSQTHIEEQHTVISENNAILEKFKARREACQRYKQMQIEVELGTIGGDVINRNVALRQIEEQIKDFCN